MEAPASGGQYCRFYPQYTVGGNGPIGTGTDANFKPLTLTLTSLGGDLSLSGNFTGGSDNVTAVPGKVYTATVAVGQQLSQGCPDYFISLLVGSTVVSTGTITAANVPVGGFVNLSTTYVAPASGGPTGAMYIQIGATNFSQTNGVPTVGIADNVQMSVGDGPVTAPAAPSNFTATAASTSEIDLAWQGNSDNETGFLIERGTDSGFTRNVTMLVAAANATSYADTNLYSGTTYYYRVLSTNTANISAYSNAASATTGVVTVLTAPSNLSATAVSASQINLSWTDNSNNETGFKIDQATSSDFTTEPDHGDGWRQRDHLQRHRSVGQHHVLLPRTGHQRQRRLGQHLHGERHDARRRSGRSQRSDGRVVSASQINLSWTDNSNNETGFKIDQATSSDFSTGLTTVTVGANVTTYSATGLSSHTTYYYRVRATNAVGDSANTSTASATDRHTCCHSRARWRFYRIRPPTTLTRTVAAVLRSHRP